MPTFSDVHRSVWSLSYWVVYLRNLLGRGAHCDNVAEILDCGKTTVNDMFKSFLRNYSAAFYDVHVYVPEGEEMDQVIADYTKMGFPGCVGSIDVTHLMWKQYPSALRHVCTGRYHCPSVAFQMVCAHTRRIHHVSRPFYGATNDISITYNDSYPMYIKIECFALMIARGSYFFGGELTLFVMVVIQRSVLALLILL